MEYAAAKNISSLPLQFNDTPSSLESRTATVVDGFFALVDRLVKIPKEEATFNSAVLPFIRAENEFLRAKQHISFYAGQSPNAKLRDASRKASKLFGEANIRLDQRRDFYELLKHVLDTEENLDADYLYWLKNIVTSYEKTGLSIKDPEKAERYAAIKERRQEVTSAIIKNLNDEKSGIWFTEEELVGLPAEFIESHRREREGHADSIWVTFKNPDLVAVDRSAESSETRKRLFLANENKLPANVALYRELFLLRDESARLLGHDNYAQYSTRFQELGSLDKVMSFLETIDAHTRAPAERYYAATLKIKEKWLAERGQANPHPGTLFRWDESFYMGKLRELESWLDYKLVDEYFPLDHCLKKCFEYFHRLFGMRIEKVDASDIDVWHEDVKMYAMLDDDNEAFLGWLYLDLFPRDGKYSHFGHNALQPVSNPPAIISAAHRL
jgi:metallopeptidase MepB